MSAAQPTPEERAPVDEALRYKTLAQQRKQRVLALIEVQYGMVYDIADLMNSLYEEIHTLMVEHPDESKHGKRIARYMFEDLAALCPDQPKDTKLGQETPL